MPLIHGLNRNEVRIFEESIIQSKLPFNSSTGKLSKHGMFNLGINNCPVYRNDIYIGSLLKRIGSAVFFDVKTGDIGVPIHTISDDRITIDEILDKPDIYTTSISDRLRLKAVRKGTEFYSERVYRD